MNLRMALSAAAAAQAVLVALAWWPSDPVAADTRALLDLRPADVTALEIASNGGDTRVALERRGEEWVFAELGAYPADAEEVSEVLDALAELRVDEEPVTRQAVSQIAMDVSEEQFGRRLTLTTREGEQTLYLGSSRGSTVHARLAHEDETYTARGARLVSFPSSVGSYVDTSWVEVDDEELAELRITNPAGELVLIRTDDAWTVGSPELPGDAALDTDALQRVVDRATSLRLRAPAAGDANAVRAGADIRVTWTSNDGETGGFVLGADEDGTRLGARDGEDYVVEVSASTASALADASVEGLVDEEDGE